MKTWMGRSAAGVAAVTVAGLVLAGCTSGGGDTSGATEIVFLTYNGDDAVAFAEQAAAEFNKANPDYTVKIDTRPSGTEGDNLVKTRLSTGEMSEVFLYNSGSLMQALSPDNTLTDLSEEAWVADVTDDFRSVVSTDQGVYGAPIATSYAGGIIYNKKVYADLGLDVPTSWDEYIANNDKIKAAGLAPVFQSYGDSWTSQVSVLGAFANVLAQDPKWAEQYTANKRSFAEEPAFASFADLEALHKGGYFNSDFASATFEDASRALSQGEAAHYPIVTTFMYAVAENYPDQVEDLGFFAIPAANADDTQATVWQPDALYIPASVEGEKLAAAKAFIAFVNSPRGCELQSENYVAVGPFANTCELPTDTIGVVKDIQAYIEAGKSAPALEFLSPVKGPNLESYTVEVGSGLRSAADAAKLYDQDVEKQAQQLGLEGW